ncbi:GSU0071 family protein [Geomesophilobacter sediminis]|uniref:Uncharacterized protein n=1 Tax=Geomesophilobacter sediminis TaxID=2798584 RepID=A0A8J7SAB1_9BACT|nr:hypothetical protein [Geomesophilobacter sediminis]MBJ6727236.1 hypothetical protein [Geomesophilobacter sediminis]
MDTMIIDIELEHYYRDRLATSSREACRRFYIRAVSRFNGAELETYLARVRSHAVAYASLSHVLRSPFRHMETPLFLSSLVLLLAGIITVVSGETSLIVACGTSAGIVGMFECARKLAKYWERHSVREAVFLELQETLEDFSLQRPV